MTRAVLFIHGAGGGAYEADRLLADSLQNALGAQYAVHFPKLPEQDGAQYSDWIAVIEKTLASLDDGVALVGHSVGGSVLLKYLCGQPVPRLAGLFSIAAPFWGADDFWQWKEASLPADAASKLEGDWPLFLYHARDDEVVPFAHLGLYATKLRRATLRTPKQGGHQFENDLTDVAKDVRANWRGR